MEGGVGADRHSPPLQPTDARRPPRFQGRKRGVDGCNGVKACSGSGQHRPGPPLFGTPGPSEGLLHSRLGPPDHRTGGLLSEA